MKQKRASTQKITKRSRKKKGEKKKKRQSKKKKGKETGLPGRSQKKRAKKKTRKGKKTGGKDYEEWLNPCSLQKNCKTSGGGVPEIESPSHDELPITTRALE